MRKFYVYRHIRKDTNTPFYVGKGTRNRAFEKCKSKRGEYWHNIVKKAGYEVEIIMDDLSEEEAFEKEIEFIDMYRGLGYCEANFTDGGEGLSNPTQEVRNKIAKSLGQKPFNVYKYETEELVDTYQSQAECARILGLIRRNIGRALKCKTLHRGYYFRFLDEDQSIDKNKPSHNLGKKRTLEQRNNLSLAQGSKPFEVWEVKIERYGIKIKSIEKLRLVGEWVNVMECSRNINIHPSLIRDCLKGKQRTTKNKYTFKYKGNNDE